MKIIFFVLYLILPVIVFAQTLKLDVSPGQDFIGAPRNSIIEVRINQSIGSLHYSNSTFRVNGSNSGLVDGNLQVDTLNNSFLFIPAKQFFTGEIINVSFGPLYISDGDTLRSFNWRFTVEITNPTNSNFDSLARFNVGSIAPIAIDYNKDGFIDIVSGYFSQVIYNDGQGGFLQRKIIKELYNVKYIDDLNNDNIPDIITSYETYFGTADGSYVLSEEFGGGIIAKGDINGDGHTDIISAKSYNDFDHMWEILLNDGAGKFFRNTPPTYLKNSITQANLVDMDKDGDLDLVLFNSWPRSSEDFDGMYLYFNNGNGQFKEIMKQFILLPFEFGVIEDLRQLFVSDYDKNGLNDVAGFGSMSGGAILLQDELNVFNSNINTYFGGAENFAFFTSGDMNGDNRFDIIISNMHTWGPQKPDDSFYVWIGINCPEHFFSCDSIKGEGFFLGTRNQIGGVVVPILADVDNDGDLDIIHSGYLTTVTYNKNTITDIREDINIPNEFYLSQNYPNPFNSQTRIDYSIPVSGNVSISIYNVLGELIEVAVDKFHHAGSYNIILDMDEINSGLYLYLISYNSKSLIKKMIYLK